MLDQAGLVVGGGNFPQFLDADRVGLRIVALAQTVALHQLLGQRPAAALGEQRVAGAQFHAALEVVGGFAVLADAHVAGGDADDAAVFLQQFRGGETGIDLHAELLGLLAQPAHDIAERDDVVAVIVHLRRRRQLERPVLGQEQEAVLACRRVQRRTLLLPVGDEFVQRARLDHGAGQDVAADLAGLFHQADRHVGGQLLQPDRRRQAGRPAADDHHVELHRFPLGQLLRHFPLLAVCRASIGPMCVRMRYRANQRGLADIS